MKKAEREKILPQERYLPFLPQGMREQDMLKPRLLIATPTIPDRACGKARRVGSIRVHNTMFSLYRLHIMVENQQDQVMLPNLFVFVDDGFVEYAAWSATKTS